MGKFEVPFTVTPQEASAQRADIIRTAAHHGIHAGTAVIFGGAALALYGIPTSVPMLAERMPRGGRTSFDIDAVAMPSSPKWRWGIRGKNSQHYAATVEAPIPLTLIRGNDARALAYGKFGYPDLEAMLADQEKVDGLGVLSLGGIVRGKLGVNSDRVKDRVGILAGHLIATEHGNPIVSDPHWQWAVRTVVDRLDPDREDVPRGIDPRLPRWVNDLRMSGFDHPAFDSVNVVRAEAA